MSKGTYLKNTFCSNSVVTKPGTLKFEKLKKNWKKLQF